MQDGVEGFEVNSWCCSFVIVNAPVLCIPFCHITDFVLHYLATVVAFLFADEFALQGALTMWYFRAGDKDEDLEVFKAFQFMLTPCDPKLMFRRGPEASACAHVCSSSDSVEGSREPSLRAVSASSMDM